jgi:tetratricopeptide (TPR) repeat protein
MIQNRPVDADWHKRIMRLIVDRDYDAAQRLSRLIEHEVPQDERHSYEALQAFLYDSMGDKEEAIRSILNAKQYKPDELAYIYLHAGLLFRLLRWHQAAEIYRELERLSVQRSELFFLNDCRAHLAICLMRIGRHEEASLVTAQLPDDFETNIQDRTHTKQTLQSDAIS